MLKRALLVVMLLAIPIAFVVGQPRPYHQVSANCYTDSTTVRVAFGFDCWYLKVRLIPPNDGSGGGSATVTRWMNGTAIETVSGIRLEDDQPEWESWVQCDSISVVLTDADDYFCYEAAR